MSDNTKKKISLIKTGEMVQIWNESLNKKEIKEVDFVYKNISKKQQMFELELVNGEIIKVTGNHKVLLTNNKYKRVDTLTTSDDILTI